MQSVNYPTDPRDAEFAAARERGECTRHVGARAATGRDGKHYVAVSNFPGLSAELSVADARGIAEQLLRAADAAERGGA